MTYIPKTFSRICRADGVAAAMAAMSAGESLYVNSGSVTLSANLVPKADTSYYFDNVTIDTTGYSLVLSTARTRATGFLKLTGAGEATARTLLLTSGADVDWLGCDILLVPTGAGLTKGSGPTFQVASSILYGARHRHRITCRSITYTLNGTVSSAVVVHSGQEGYVNATIDTIYNSTVNNQNLIGLFYLDYGVTARSLTADVKISGVTVAAGTGGVGDGLVYACADTKGLVRGHIRGCTTNNVTWGGGSYNSTGLVLG